MSDWIQILVTRNQNFQTLVWFQTFFSNSEDHSWDQCKSEVKRNFFWRAGVGVLKYSDPKWHWNAPFTTPEAKKFLGEDPQPPLQEDV